MVKKLKTLVKPDDKQLAAAVRTSAQQIWQAGLGAFVKAQAEGGKVFAKLVKDGTDLQKRTRHLAEDKVSGVSDTVTRLAETVGKQAAGSWDKLEQVFEDRVARSLSSLGVPNQKDIRNLTKRVEELSKSVAVLTGKKPATKAAAVSVRKVVAKKPVAKPSVKVPAKAASKPAAKTGVKKAAPKAAAKAAAKTPVKAPPAKAAAKTRAARPAVKKPVTIVAAVKAAAD